MKKDVYHRFAELERCETEGKDFRIRSLNRQSTTVIIAPHGGGIEPRTSAIARAIAGRNLSFYSFERIERRSGNSRLHITSPRFDEPQCVALVRASANAISIHGKQGKERAVYVGGQDKDALEALRVQLEEAGFCARMDGGPSIGIQLGLMQGLLNSFFVTKNGRERKSPRFRKCVAAVRRVIVEEEDEACATKSRGARL